MQKACNGRKVGKLKRAYQLVNESTLQMARVTFAAVDREDPRFWDGRSQSAFRVEVTRKAIVASARMQRP